MGLKVIESYWFETIGIVVCEDETTGVRKAYIGIGSGIDQNSDEEYIRMHGQKFLCHAAEEIADRLKENDLYE